MDLKNRVQQRIDELGQSPITLARKVGLERGYINDILIGRKSTIRGDKINLVAKALRCDPSFLTEDSPTPQISFQPPGIDVWGACQSGIWREKDAKADYPLVLPIAPDARFPQANQGAFVIRGLLDSEAFRTAALGIEPATFEQSVHPIESGMVVAIKRKRGELIETSLRMVETGPRPRLVSLPQDQNFGVPIPLIPENGDEGVTILAVITCSVTLMI